MDGGGCSVGGRKSASRHELIAPAQAGIAGSETGAVRRRNMMQVLRPARLNEFAVTSCAWSVVKERRCDVVVVPVG